MRNDWKLNELQGLIVKYDLKTLPETDVAKQIHRELNAKELLGALDRPTIYDLALLKGLGMTVTEFRQAQKQALYLHLLEEAERFYTADH